MKLTQADSGGRRSARVGETFTVALAESPTTGYRWHAEIDASALLQTNDRFDGPTEPRGAAGTRQLTFTVLRAGLTRLTVVKRRSWEADVVDEFALDIQVEAD